MNDKEFAALCARINGSIDVGEFIALMDYFPDKAIKQGGLWRMFCPVHEDRVFRTLVINPRRNTCHCEHGACPIHQPGDLIDLLAKVRGEGRKSVLELLLGHFGADGLRLTERQKEALSEYLAESSDEPSK